MARRRKTGDSSEQAPQPAADSGAVQGEEGRIPAMARIGPRDREMIEAVAAGASWSDAGKLVGYSPKQVAARKRSSLVREAMLEAFEAAGITATRVARHLEHIIFEAEKKAVTKDGEVVSLGPDYYAQLKGMELVADVADVRPSKSGNISVSSNIFIVPSENTMAAANPFSAPIVDGEYREVKDG